MVGVLGSRDADVTVDVARGTPGPGRALPPDGPGRGWDQAHRRVMQCSPATVKKALSLE